MALLLGTDTNDTLIGTPEADFISGYVANDILQGMEGNDELNGNSQNDTIYGGIGNDLAHGGQDNDLIFGDIGNDIIYGDLGNDTVSGGDGDDLLFGNSEDDVINGNIGNDTIYGGKGNDILRGGLGNDLVSGDLGDDFIYGDIGIDTLTGGDGLDTFFLRKGLGGPTVAEADIITDYVDGADKIGLIEGLTLSILNVFQGTGNNAADTIIQDAANGQFLAVLKGVNRSLIDATDFVAPKPTFLNPTPNDDDGFSNSVAAVGNNVLIGADNAGAAYLFDGTTGALLQTFLNPTPNVFGSFGNSVAAVGNNVLIGAYRDDTGATNAGATYLFDATTGELLRTFLNPTPNNGDYFGNSVAAVGNNVLIGASGDDTGGLNAGAAYLFDGTTGALLRTFLNPTPSNGDRFGNSVAAVGNKVLIGASSDDAGAADAGAAYLFDSTTGALLRTFLNPTPNNGDYFGNSVAAVGNNVLIGAVLDDTGGLNAGAAYLFDGTTGALLRTFLNPTRGNPDRFGGSVAAVGNNVLIGTPGDSTNNPDPVAAAYLFDGTTGALLQTFLNPTPNYDDYFGSSVAAVGNNVLIGAPGDDTNGLNAGAAYLF